MAGVTADSVVVLLTAQIDKYQRDMEAAAKKTEAVFARIRAASAKPIVPTVGGKGGTSAAEKEAIRVEGVRQREAAKTAGVRDRLEAKSADVAAKAESRKADAAEKAEARRVAAAEKADAAIAASAAKSAARAPVNVIGGAGVGKTQAQYEAELERTAAARAAIPPRATPLMASTSLSTGGQAGAEAAVNGELVEQTRLRAALIASSEADTVAIRDQLFLFKQINDYKKAGLAETEAIALADADLIAIETRRTAQLAEQLALKQKQTQESLAANAGKVASGLNLVGPGIVAGLGLAELSHLNDEYIRFSNSLKVAGVSADDFDSVQAHLLQTATRTGAGIESLSDLFRGAALASHDLGASQADILKVTDAVANSLRITGASGNAARAAILQLGHAFETGRVTAREFNGLQLNAYPILQAVAAGSDKYGGSVQKLRAALLAGDLTSKEFFANLLAGAHTLEGPASRATLTTAQGFTSLNNALVVYFGTADKANGVSAALGQALQAVAANLNILIPAIAAVSTALTVGLVVRMVEGAAAAEGLGAAVLGAFGGPVGIAITAVALAVGAFVVASNSATNATNAHGGAANNTAKAVDTLNNILNQDPSKGVATNARALAAARLQQANATYQAAAAEIALRKSQAAARVKELGTGATATLTTTTQGRGGPIKSQTTYGNRQLALMRAQANKDASDADSDQASLDAALANAKKNIANAPFAGAGLSAQSQKAINNLTAKIDGLEKIASQQSGKQRTATEAKITKANQQLDYLKQGIAPSAASAGVGGGGARGVSQATLDKRAAAAAAKIVKQDDTFATDKTKLNALIISAKGRQADSIQQQYSADIANAAEENKERHRQYQNELNEGKLGVGKEAEARLKILDGLSDQVAAQKTLTAAIERSAAIADQASKNYGDAIQNVIDAKQSQLSIATTQAARAKIEQELLDEEYKQKRNVLDNDLANAKKNGDTGAAANIQTKIEGLAAGKSADQVNLDKKYQGPIANYLDSIADPKAQVEAAVLDKLKSVDEAITDAAAGVLGVKDPFLKSLLQIFLQQNVLKPLYDAFQNRDGGGGIGGIFSSILGAFGGGSSGTTFNSGTIGTGSILNFGGGRASGGNVSAGKIYQINENGPEYFQPAQSGKIIPTGRATAASGGGNTTVVQQTFTIDNRGGITTPQLLQYVNQKARQEAAAAGKAAYNNSPQRSQKLQQLGS